MISHVYLDGSERPIVYASRTLTIGEKNYPQIEREALSLVYGIQKFHQYLYGRKFVLQCGKPECQSTSADAAFVIGQVQALPVTAE